MVYFIECNGYVKVGHTARDAMSRMADLQTGHPGRMRLMAVIKGGMGTEASIHRELEDYGVGGEWFALCAGSKRALAKYIGSFDGEAFRSSLSPLELEELRIRVRMAVDRAYKLGVGASALAEAINVEWGELNGVLRQTKQPTVEMVSRLDAYMASLPQSSTH
jgi:hypothetical protein